VRQHYRPLTSHVAVHQPRLVTGQLERDELGYVGAAQKKCPWCHKVAVVVEPGGSTWDGLKLLTVWFLRGLVQFLVNKNMAKQDSPIKVNAGTVEILRFPGTYSTGRYSSPVPFGGMGKPVDQSAFSDHLPIGTRIAEAD